MRNISLSDFESYSLNRLQECESFTYDRRIFYACNNGIVIKIQDNNEEVICNLRENLYPVPDEDDIPKVLDITYSCEKDVLYLILDNGDIVSIEVNGGSGTENCLGSIPSGIKCAQWSPEQEVIALVTGDENVLVMTNDFDPVSEVELHSDHFGEKQFITIGWGKKETQFRGSEGKFNAKSINNEALVEKNISNDNKTQISWRGDAEFFVVSSINPKTSDRYLRIFNKSGILQFTSESLSGLEDCMDWRPSGNVIAIPQKLPNKYIISFFEKNGLKHGEFELPFSYKEFKVCDVSWSKDSRILAVFVTKIPDEGVTKDLPSTVAFIQLFTTSNYHWYHKYTINFHSGTIPLSMQWNLQQYYTLHVTVKKEKNIYHNKYSWLWVTNKSKGTDLKDESLVAVIDGCNLRLSSFKRGIIPPPMSTYTLELPVSVNSVSFAPADDGGHSNNLFVQLSDGSLSVFKFCTSNDNSNEISYELHGKLNDLSKEFEICFNIQWVAPNTFMMCNIKMNKSKSESFLGILDIKEFGSTIIYKIEEIPLESTIAILKAFKSFVVLHKNNGKLYSVDKNKKNVTPLFVNNKRTLIELDLGCKENDYYVFGLDNLNKFYVNDKLLFNNILSFHVHDKFVLLTNLKHQLLCLNFEEELPNTDDLTKIYTRRVERGSRIVTSLHKDLKVILQMPRGNLECIQPRALSLFVLGKYLDSLNYYEAFDLMRKQRINLNLLYDHDPIVFATNLSLFVEQVKDPLWISLFISDLIDDDVSKTMYPISYKSRVVEALNGKSKIEHVCELVEKELQKKENSEKYLLPILTCYIKRGKIEFLETALLKLKNLKEKELNGVKLAVSFDEAFRYILYLIDVEELYKIALGMYDFDLVLIVANKSQKDPKEYMPFLNDLKKLEPNYQKYTIDKYLKRYKKALTHLILCDGDDVFNECINFIKTHKLYKFALKLISENTDRYKNVCICYGEELMKSNLFEEAGIMYSNAGMYKDAIEAYKKSGNWQEVITCGREMKLSENESSELYLDVAMELSESKRFKEASIVYLDYLKDVEECVRTLCNGKYFAEAYRVAHLHNRTELINLIIVPAVIEQGNVVKLHIANFNETFVKQKNRLKVLREQKLEASENKNPYDGENDLYSETSTIITQSYASRTSNKTYRSAKNRRKQERKLLSLKEGSPYEDLALITSLYTIATNCVELKSEIKELNKFLIKFRQFEMAQIIQNELDDLLTLIEKSKSEIWTPELLFMKQNYGPDSTSNEIAEVYMKSENIAPILINPKFTIPPEVQNNVQWKLEILNP